MKISPKFGLNFKIRPNIRPKAASEKFDLIEINPCIKHAGPIYFPEAVFVLESVLIRVLI